MLSVPTAAAAAAAAARSDELVAQLFKKAEEKRMREPSVTGEENIQS